MTTANYPSMAEVMAAMEEVDRHHQEQDQAHRQAVQDAQSEPGGAVDSGGIESSALG